MTRREQSEYIRAWRNGLTVAQLRQFIEDHGAECYICRRPWDDTVRGGGLVLDHDHRCCGAQSPNIPVADRPKRLCGKCLRGLLCIACNAALGQLGSSIDRLDRAREYLARGPIPIPEKSPQYRFGVGHPMAKLDDSAVRDIRDRLGRGYSVRTVAEHFGVSIQTIYGIRSGRFWSHVA